MRQIGQAGVTGVKEDGPGDDEEGYDEEGDDEGGLGVTGKLMRKWMKLMRRVCARGKEILVHVWLV